MRAVIKILTIAYLVGVVFQTRPQATPAAAPSQPDLSRVTHTKLAYQLKQRAKLPTRPRSNHYAH